MVALCSHESRVGNDSVQLSSFSVKHRLGVDKCGCFCDFSRQVSLCHYGLRRVFTAIEGLVMEVVISMVFYDIYGHLLPLRFHSL